MEGDASLGDPQSKRRQNGSQTPLRSGRSAAGRRAVGNRGKVGRTSPNEEKLSRRRAISGAMSVQCISREYAYMSTPTRKPFDPNDLSAYVPPKFLQQAAAAQRV